MEITVVGSMLVMAAGGRLFESVVGKVFVFGSSR